MRDSEDSRMATATASKIEDFDLAKRGLHSLRFDGDSALCIERLQWVDDTGEPVLEEWSTVAIFDQVFVIVNCREIAEGVYAYVAVSIG